MGPEAFGMVGGPGAESYADAPQGPVSAQELAALGSSAENLVSNWPFSRLPGKLPEDQLTHPNRLKDKPSGEAAIVCLEPVWLSSFDAEHGRPVVCNVVGRDTSQRILVRTPEGADPPLGLLRAVQTTVEITLGDRVSEHSSDRYADLVAVHAVEQPMPHGSEEGGEYGKEGFIHGRVVQNRSTIYDTSLIIERGDGSTVRVFHRGPATILSNTTFEGPASPATPAPGEYVRARVMSASDPGSFYPASGNFLYRFGEEAQT
jgi:hypothetical protein